MNSYILTALLISSATSTAPVHQRTSTNNTPVEKVISVEDIKIVQETKKVEVVVKTMEQFLTKIGHQESSNNYRAVNQFGYMGRYQFGKSTLKSLGINVTKEQYLSNSSLQERSMVLLLKANKHTLRNYISKHVGETINNIYITESGILAAAHLAGAGNVIKFFKNGKEFRDGNGTKMTKYLNKFKGYNLNL